MLEEENCIGSTRSNIYIYIYISYCSIGWLELEALSLVHKMQKRYDIFSVLCSLLVGGLWFSASLFVVTDAVTDEESGKAILCRTDWNGDSETAIPDNWINDGYCDCPFDAKDEPDTDACSGSLSWAGVNSISRYVVEIDWKYDMQRFVLNRSE